MLYLTDPGAPGTFQTWRPQKSLISPSSGELSPLQCRRLSEGDSRSLLPSQTSHRRFMTVFLASAVTLFIPGISEPELREKRASRRLETRRSLGEEPHTLLSLLLSPQSVN